MKNKSFIITIAIVIIALSSIAQEKGTFTDARDGKTYKTVKIGTQTWFAQNLAYKLDSGCFAYSNSINNLGIYGYLYSWNAAKIASPPGWHLPSVAEWQQLIDFLGGAGIAGNKLKEVGTTHWESLNTYASDAMGFTALPGGCRDTDTKFKFFGIKGFWWSSTQPNAFSASYFFITNNGSFLTLDYCNKLKCYSVRCIKD